jgi:hypothetical protein
MYIKDWIVNSSIHAAHWTKQSKIQNPKSKIPMSFLSKLDHLDRRWIFLLVALAVLIPLLFPLRIPLQTSSTTQAYYDRIETLPEGSLVLLSTDFDPGSKAELYPMTEATIRHLFRKNHKIVIFSLWPAGPPMSELALQRVLEERGNDKKEGVDYVNLGYKDGREAVIVELGRSIKEAFPLAYDGTPVGEIPIMEKVENYSSFPLFANISVGYPGTKEYVQYAQSRFNITMISGAGAVSVPEFSAYMQSGQLKGMLSGVAGCAEYEQLLNRPALALTFMDAQSAGHMLIVLMIVVGNVIYFLTRRKKQN